MHHMTRRDFVRTGALMGLATLAVRSEAEPMGKRPNLLYVFPDQFRVFACGFMGADPVQTPNLDRFAKESVVFANAVSNLPICTPYRGMMMTGRWPFQTGIHTNTNSGRTDIFLDPSETCLPDVLAAQGYECGYIGKYHLDAPVAEDAKYGEGKRGDGRVWDAYTPPGPRRHGFSFWHSYGCCDRHMKPHYWVGDAPREKPVEFDGVWSVKHETDVAIDFIQRKRSQPFALFVAFNPPHPPYQQVPGEYKERYRDEAVSDLLLRPNVPADKGASQARRSVADYFSAVEGVDQNFGRILAALAETGEAENTLVVFTTDHGEMMGSHGRMGKGVFQEESFRIPLFMRLPGKLRPRQDTLHINVPDMFPTLLGLLDLDDHVPAKVAGTNHAQLILTERGTRPTSTFFIGAAGVSPDRGIRAIRTDRHTFVVARQGLVQALLYDRQTDPYQQTNIADRHPELCQQLLAELNAWLKRTDDPWPQQEWPLRSSGSFAIHREGNVVRLDFEPPGDAKEVIAPDGSEGRIVTEDAIAGTRSLLADSRKTTGRWHEILHVDGIVSPNRTYELSCKYHVVAAPDKAQFYTVVRSPTTQHRAIRDFWREDDGKSGVRTVQFQTEAAKDYQVLFGVENQGAVIWDDVVLRDLGPVKA